MELRAFYSFYTSPVNKSCVLDVGSRRYDREVDSSDEYCKYNHNKRVKYLELNGHHR